MTTLATVTPIDLPPVPGQLGRSALRRRSLANVLRAGHCAPTAMRTLLDAAGAGASWPVQLVAGLPGIGNTGNECGALTASLVTLGLRHARDPAAGGVPVVVSKGRALLQDFEACHGGVGEYVASGTVSRCRGIARAVAARVRDMIEPPRSRS